MENHEKSQFIARLHDNMSRYFRFELILKLDGAVLEIC